MKRQHKRVAVIKAKSGSPVNMLCLLAVGGGIVYALALGAYREHPQHDVFDQKTHFEHRPHAPINADDQAALSALIDRSVAQADARRVPKTAVAMLELYGTEQECRWATQVAKGE